MRKSINLSLGQKRVDTVLRKIYIGTIISFCVVVAVSLGLIGYRLVLKGSYEALDSREQQLNSQLLTMVEKRDKMLEIKSRLNEVKKIVSTRSPTTKRLETVSSIVPSDSEVKGVSGNEDTIDISLESESIASLNDLIELKIEELTSDRGKGVKKVQMHSFGLNPRTHKYTVSLGIEFI